MNVTEYLFRHSHAWPERVAVVQDGRNITYEGLRRTVEALSARLAQAGVQPGECVSVGVRNPFGFISMVLALARMGAVATPLKLDATDDMRETLLERLGVDRVVLDHKQPWRSSKLPPGAHIDTANLFVAQRPGESLPLPPVANNVSGQVWFVALSSGTTGVPKGIPHTHGRTIMNVAMGHPSDTSVGVPMRLMIHTDISISIALNHFLRATMQGGTAVLATSWLPEYFFERVAIDKPTRLLTTTALVGRLVEAAARRYPDSLQLCESLQTIMVSGSVVSPALQKAITSRLCRRLDINYGAAEAGALATANEFTLEERPRSAGRLHPWVRAEALDDMGRPLPNGETGLLRFSSPTLAGGYRGDDAASERAFQDGWFYPGDLGSVDDAGYLTLAGRADDRLNFGGSKVDPVVIERVLESHPDVLESAVVGVPAGELGRLVLVAVVVARGEIDTAALQRMCREILGPSLVPRVFVPAPSLPRNEAGKVMRDRVAQGVKLERGEGTEP